MADEDHDVEVLGVYTLGLLDDEQAQTIDEHLIDCAECRTVFDELAGVHQLLAFAPPAAFVGAGVPEPGLLAPDLPEPDLLEPDPRLSEPDPLEPELPEPVPPAIPILRARRGSWARLGGLVAAAAAVLGVAVAGGVLIGRGTAGDGLAAPTTGPTTTVQPPAASGVRLATISDPEGARLTVRLEPAPGWVRVNAAVSGVPAGVRCQLVVVSRTGERRVAVSWLVSPKGEASGTNLDGGVLIPAEDVERVLVESLEGEELISATV